MVNHLRTATRIAGLAYRLLSVAIIIAQASRRG